MLPSPGRRLAVPVVALSLAATLLPDVFAQTASPPAPAAPAASAAPARPEYSDAQIEQFLKSARIVRTRSAQKGVTNSLRATLSDGTITHDAQIQVVDERKTTGPSPQGMEMNFRDSWMFNVAGYRLDRLLGMNLVPVSVERRHNTSPAAFTWWIDDVMMDEGGRLKQKLTSPRPGDWNEQMQMVRVFDQLIYNMDRNLGNLLITKDWNIWAIDHTRAFRVHKSLKTPENVTRCDRQMFERLKQLDKPTLTRELSPYLAGWEIEAILARRDLIVERLEKAGPGALFDRRDGRNLPTATASASTVR
jgi:hypothetical protein